jgi:hypothetical protein
MDVSNARRRLATGTALSFANVSEGGSGRRIRREGGTPSTQQRRGIDRIADRWEGEPEKGSAEERGRTQASQALGIDVIASR